MEEKLKTFWNSVRSPEQVIVFLYFRLNFSKVQLIILSLYNECHFDPNAKGKKTIPRIIEIKL